jgi:hypothetical protein
VIEPGREIVTRAVEESSGIVTSIVSYAEARSAFARLSREESINEEEHAAIVRALDEGWPTYERVSITESLVRLAGDLAHRHALRVDGFPTVSREQAAYLRMTLEAAEGFADARPA